MRPPENLQSIVNGDPVPVLDEERLLTDSEAPVLLSTRSEGAVMRNSHYCRQQQ